MSRGTKFSRGAKRNIIGFDENIENKKTCLQYSKEILTRYNASIITVDCGEPTSYHQHKMNFLKKPIIYTFQDPIMLSRSTYSMLISKISCDDKNVLNQLFSRIDSRIEIKDEFFINSKEVDTYDVDSENKWMIQIEIQGFKKSDISMGPIWKLKYIQRVD